MKLKTRKAFSMIELIFVIVVLGILSKFGVEFLAQAYNSFIYSSINNRLQAQSASAVEFISTRLQYRIKDSIIARKTDGTFESLSVASGSDYRILEWVGSDIDGYRGDSLPKWSGVVDLNLSSADTIVSPESNTTAINTLISVLSPFNNTISNAAIYFVGSNSNKDSYGWQGAITDQNQTMHPIKAGTNLNEFESDIAANFSNVALFEYYKLAWTAYAIVHTAGSPDATDGTLTLYYDYQPWEGDSYTDGKKAIIMKHVSSFQFAAVGSLVKVQVCVKSMLTNEEYSICKEKTVY